MERAPVAQMNNGQPYVGPPTANSDSAPNVMQVEGVEAQGANIATIWSTATVTSVELQTSVITSIIFSVSTSIEISTSIVSITGTSQAVPSVTPTATDSNTLSKSGSSSSSSSTSSTSTDLSSSSIIPSPLMNSNSSSISPAFLTGTPSNLIPASANTDNSKLISSVSNHNSLARAMAGLIGGIFFTAGLLAFGLYIVRRKTEKHSTTEANNAAERQQQPLMNEPIVPYSSAYGSNLPN